MRVTGRDLQNGHVRVRKDNEARGADGKAGPDRAARDRPRRRVHRAQLTACVAPRAEANWKAVGKQCARVAAGGGGGRYQMGIGMNIIIPNI